MLSNEEKKFVEWWEQRRLAEKKTLKQWLLGLPVGLLFGLPIFVNFFSGWYKRADMIVNSQLANHQADPLVLLIAVVIIISFVAIFSKRYKWEMHEQRYKELKAKETSDVLRESDVL